MSSTTVNEINRIHVYRQSKLLQFLPGPPPLRPPHCLTITITTSTTGGLPVYNQAWYRQPSILMQSLEATAARTLFYTGRKTFANLSYVIVRGKRYKKRTRESKTPYVLSLPLPPRTAAGGLQRSSDISCGTCTREHIRNYKPKCSDRRSVRNRRTDRLFKLRPIVLYHFCRMHNL